tara:strand:+ start:1131 stop:1427 length:297 start_codon:yes stop_codon:yes gene_type:complete
MKQYKGNVKWTEAKWLKFTAKVNEAIELLENVESFEVEDFIETVSLINRRVNRLGLNDICRYKDKKLNSFYSLIIMESRVISAYTNVNLNPLFNTWWS